MNLKKIIAFVCSSILALHGMETDDDIMRAMKTENGVWKILAKEVRVKILACADWETKIKMYMCWPKMFECTMNDLLQESPVMVSRKCFLFHLIDMARNDKKENFRKLLLNANHCNSDNFFLNMRCFLPAFDELEIVKTYIEQKHGDSFERALPHVMAICKGGDQIWNQFKTNLSDKVCWNKWNITPLNLALYYKLANSVAELLLLQNPTWLNIANHHNMNPLYFSVREKNSEMCQFLCSFDGLQINKTTYGDSALEHAIDNSYSDIARLCIQYIIKHNLQEKFFLQEDIKYNKTLWYRALDIGQIEIAKLILQQIDFQVPHQTKPLHVAVKSGGVKMLLEHPNTNINAQDENGYTALHYAVLQRDIETVKCLLDNYADVDKTTLKFNSTALWFAVWRRQVAIVKVLLEREPNIEVRSGEKSTTPLCEALSGVAFSMELTKMLLECGADLNARSGIDNAVPLHCAIKSGSVEAVKLLVLKGARVNEANDKGITPLMEAARAGALDILNALMVHGADINCQTIEGYTAFYFALKRYIDNKNSRQALNEVIDFLLMQPNLIYGPHDKKLHDKVMEIQNPKNEEEKANDQKADNCVCM